MRFFYLLVLFFCLTVTSCYDNVDNSEPPILIIEPVEVIITTEVSGQVVGVDGSAMSNYSLYANEEEYPVLGEVYTITIENALKKGQTIEAYDSNGDKVGITTQLLVENDVNQVNIQSHEPYREETLNESNSIFAINSSLQADFSKVKWEEGFSGNARIVYAEIMEDAELTVIGYTEFSDVLAVESKGGFYLESRTEDDRKLNTNGEDLVSLNVQDLPDEELGLFQYREADGVWLFVRDIRTGDDIEIEPTGYYSFGKYEEGVFVEGRITKDNGPVSFQKLIWSHDDQRSEFKSTLIGKWIALLPENQNIDLLLSDPCGNTYPVKEIMTTTEDVVNETVDANTTPISYIPLEMEVIDCEGGIVENPELLIKQGELTFIVEIDPEGSTPQIAVCDDFLLSAINEDGTSGSFLTASSSTSNNIGLVSNCINASFGRMKIRDDERIYDQLNARIEDGNTIIENDDASLRIKLKGSSVGSFENNEVNILINDENFGDRGYFMSCENSTIGCGIMEMEVTQFSENGEVRVDFSGELWMQTLSPSVAGTWPVKGELVASF